MLGVVVESAQQLNSQADYSLLSFLYGSQTSLTSFMDPAMTCLCCCRRCSCCADHLIRPGELRRGRPRRTCFWSHHEQNLGLPSRPWPQPLLCYPWDTADGQERSWGRRKFLHPHVLASRVTVSRLISNCLPR